MTVEFQENFNTYSDGEAGRDEFYALPEIEAGTLNSGFVIDPAGRTGKCFKVGGATTRRLTAWRYLVDSPSAELKFSYSYFQSTYSLGGARSHVVLISTDSTATGLSIAVDDAGKMVFYRNNTTQSGITVDSVIPLNQWVTVAVSMTLNSSLGEVLLVVKVDGVEVFNSSIILGGNTLTAVGVRSKDSSFAGADFFLDDLVVGEEPPPPEPEGKPRRTAVWFNY